MAVLHLIPVSCSFLKLVCKNSNLFRQFLSTPLSPPFTVICIMNMSKIKLIPSCTSACRDLSGSVVVQLRRIGASTLNGTLP